MSWVELRRRTLSSLSPQSRGGTPSCALVSGGCLWPRSAAPTCIACKGLLQDLWQGALLTNRSPGTSIAGEDSSVTVTDLSSTNGKCCSKCSSTSCWCCIQLLPATYSACSLETGTGTSQGTPTHKVSRVQWVLLASKAGAASKGLIERRCAPAPAAGTFIEGVELAPMKAVPLFPGATVIFGDKWLAQYTLSDEPDAAESAAESASESEAQLGAA